MKIIFTGFPKQAKAFICFFLFINAFVYSQCNTTNFTVTKTNAICTSNGEIKVTVPTSTNCNGWVAEVLDTSTNTPVTLSIPQTGGDVIFSSLAPGSYNVSLSNGFTTLNHLGNPVIITTSYVDMSVNTSFIPPSYNSGCPAYSANGKLTVNVPTGGIGPFEYTVSYPAIAPATGTVTYTFTTPNRTYQFLNMDGGVTAQVKVKDLANNMPGCQTEVVQNPVLGTSTTANLSFVNTTSVKPFNFYRDCSNITASCTNVLMYVNLGDLTAERLAYLQQPGNAKIRINGVDYPLVYDIVQNRFKYDPVYANGPVLSNGMTFTVTMNWGCTSPLTNSGTVSLNDSYVGVSTSSFVTSSTCLPKYRINISGSYDSGSGKYLAFCPSNTVKIERRISTGPDVWQEYVIGTDAIPVGTYDPNNALNIPANYLTQVTPNAANSFEVNQAGYYRVTVSDGCHSAINYVNASFVYGLSDVSIGTTPSLLQGTGSMNINTGYYGVSLFLKMKISRVDGQTSITINPSQPLNYANSYTINFPIEKTTYNTGAWNSHHFFDLPPGQYRVQVEDGCSPVSGIYIDRIITINPTASYNPQFTINYGCSNSNSITYNLNRQNAWGGARADLHRKNPNGSYTFVQSLGFDSGTFNNVGVGDYRIYFEGVGSPWPYSFSAAFNYQNNWWGYYKDIKVLPYENFKISTGVVLCDIGNPNSGIVSVQIVSGTISYPVTFSLFDVNNPNTPIQGPFTVNNPVNSYVFQNVPVGNYFVRVTSPCYSADKNVNVTSVNTIPTAEVLDSAVCPNSPATLAIISATSNLFDITWTDQNNNIIGTGMPLTVIPTQTTTYTATYSIKSTFGCSNTSTNTSSVTVTVTPNPILTLAVSDFNKCNPNPVVTIANTQINFTYEIVDANGNSFSPQIIGNGNGGLLTISIPSSVAQSLSIGQILKVKTTNGNAGCTGFLTDTINVLGGTFAVVCPTFASTSLQCYDDLPSQTSYTIAQFQALGNGDGLITSVDRCGIVQITASNSVFTTCNSVVTRTYTVKEFEDTNGNGILESTETTVLNTTNCTQTININDTTAPVVTGTLSAQNISGCSLTAAPAAMTTVAALESAGLTISDNCTSDLNLVVSSVDGTASGTCPITFTRTYTITDACNNSITATQTININDTTAPVVTGTLSAQNISGCSLTAAPAAMTTVAALESAGLTISDNCTSDLNLVVSSVDGTASGTCPITFTRTYTITDACNNSITATQTININDTTAPVVTGTLSAQNISGCSLTAAPSAMTTVAALESAGLTISDNCTSDLNLVVSSVDGTASGTCPITFTRTYTITDACNNSITATQTININDTTAPVVTGTLSAQNVSGCSLTDAPSAMTTVAALESAGLTISDNCLSDLNLVVSSVDGTASGTCPITFTRTYTITDACNNSITATQTININDTTAPVVTGTLSAQNVSGCSLTDAPSAMTTVAALESAGLTISDNCTSDLNLVVSSVDGTASGTCPITFTRTYTITDACNNSITATQTININDTTAPVVTGTLSAQNVSGCSLTDAPSAMTTVAALESAGLTISDNCTSDLNLVVSSVDGTASGTCPITFTRTYTITDACNNSITATQTININDTTAPVVTGTLSAQNISGCSLTDAPSAMTTVAALESAGLTISDNCTSDSNLVVSSVDGTASGTCPITFTRTYTITDACNNSITATQTININDTTAPVVTGTLSAQNISGCSLTAAPAAMTTVAALESAGLTISDNCTSDLNLVVSSVDGTASGTCPITFTRTYTITDACNNSITATQTININDTTAPVVTGTLSAQNISGCSLTAAPSAMTTVAALESAGLTISDNCTSDSNLVVSSVDGTASGTCPITFTRTYTITDACNNSITATQTINISDTTAPVVQTTIGSLNVSLECSNTSGLTAALALIPTATDNCTSPVLHLVSDITTVDSICSNAYVRVRTWNFTDACGNTSTSFVQTITVQDTTAPVFSGTLPQDVTLECNQTIPASVSLTATDSCGGNVTVSFSEQTVAGSCANNYTLFRTWTATDVCGNFTTHIQEINVQDTTPPVFVETLPAAEIYAKCDGIPVAPTLTATDNCGAVTVSYNEVRIDGDCTNKYRLERTWTAIDACGNETEFNQTVYLACYVTPYNALSPDGDGLNDIFIIEGLECYPNNSVEIFNRWGVKIFEASFYDNVNTVFRGMSDGRVTVSRNDKLPTGTYFYKLKYEYDLYGREKENIEKTGYIYIQNE